MDSQFKTMQKKMAGTLSFYPSEKYLKKNWAPEKIPVNTLKHLASAQRRAVEQGVISPNLANKMLPNTLVEGWDTGYGVVGGTYGYPASKERDAILQKMGLVVSDYPTNNVNTYPDVMRDQKAKAGYWVPSGLLSADTDRFHKAYASLVPVILAEKARLYGEDKAIERWNGKGRAIEDNGYDDAQVANAMNHVKKVDEMMRMLNHPANAELLNMYKGLLSPKE
jgi:hypothetical protein